MRVRVGCLIACLGACNWAFGLENTGLAPSLDAAARPDGDPRADLDRDGIKDVVDSCIAPATDGLIDSDLDGVINDQDGCPFDKAATADADGDGIGDACDPYPASPGDRKRCLMALTDPDMNVAMWKPREDVPMPWTLYEPRELIGGSSSIVADWPFESTATTIYDIRGRLLNPAAGAFAALPRAALMPSPSDVGCQLTINSMGWTLNTVPPVGAPVAVASMTGFGVPYRMVVTIEPGASGSNVGCAIQIGGGAIQRVSARVSLTPTNLGFSTSVYLTIDGITIFERDDASAL